MFLTAKELIDYCSKNSCKISDYVLDWENKESKHSKEEIREELKKMFEIMENSSKKNLDSEVSLHGGMITGFAKKTNDYRKKNQSITGDFILKAMAMAFSTFETNSNMGEIVASPTAGSSGILPAALISAKEKLDSSTEEIVEAMLTAVGIGQFIGGYATFAGAEGGCQAECGAAASMAAAALVQLYGGTPSQCLEGASIALVNVLGLVCDPIGGLVEYPCTFRNASGVINAMISADLAMAGTYSIVPFEEVCQAMNEVGKAMAENLRETGTGGLADTKTGRKIREEFFKGTLEKK